MSMALQSVKCIAGVTIVYVMSNFTSSFGKVMANYYIRDQILNSYFRMISSSLRERERESSE